MGTKPLKVLLVNHGDAVGGAAIVTYRLTMALRDIGVDAKMLVFTKTSDSEVVELASTRSIRSRRFLRETLSCATANGWKRSTLFAISTGRSGLDLTAHPLVQEADVICLNWINQGLLSLKGIDDLGRLGKPIVWTMHDMWNMTGICHQANDCQGYRNGCGYCPYIRSGKWANDRSALVAKAKARLYKKHKFTFVAVSNWLKERAMESSLLSNQDVRVIHNAFPVEYFVSRPSVHIKSFDIDYSRNIIIMGAARLDDPVKGLDYAIDALNEIFDTHPEVANKSLAVLFGNLRDNNALKRLRFSYRYLGRISDPKLLRQLYATGSVVLSTSLSETLPGTLIEGQAAGCVPVTFGNGGQADIVDHLKTGYIAEYKSSSDIARGIMWALENPLDREMLHSEVERKFNSPLIAHQYLDLFLELLHK